VYKITAMTNTYKMSSSLSSVACSDITNWDINTTPRKPPQSDIFDCFAENTKTHLHNVNIGQTQLLNFCYLCQFKFLFLHCWKRR